MDCKNCQIELEQIEGKEGKVFCSDKCRKAYNRKLTSDKISVPTTDKPTSDAQKVITSDNHINRWGKDVREMDAGTLYAYIGAYPEDTWKDSPEFKELTERLKMPVKKLREQGYWIPSSLEPCRV